MQRRNVGRLGSAVFTAVVLAAGSTMPTAGAAAAPGNDDMQAALERDLGLTAAEARTRVRQESVAVRVEKDAKRAAGGAYGGSWFDAETGKLVVAVTDEATGRAVRRTGASTVTVPNSERELNAAKARLDKTRVSKIPEGVHGWHVDPRESRVVVTVSKSASDTSAVREFLTHARSATSDVRVTIRSTDGDAPQTYAAGTVGGDPFYINGNTRCSIGFSVHGGFVTAGHCGDVGSWVNGWDGSAMGNFERSDFPGDDMAFVRIGHGWWTVPVVLGWGTVPDRLVRGSAEMPVGASICRSGSTTHWHCGTVLGKNWTVRYGDVLVHGLTHTSVCAEPGDSGGSYISGEQAQGVTSGGWGNCASGGETWYQPVNEILHRYGLTLHTY